MTIARTSLRKGRLRGRSITPHCPHRRSMSSCGKMAAHTCRTSSPVIGPLPGTLSACLALLMSSWEEETTRHSWSQGAVGRRSLVRFGLSGHIWAEINRKFDEIVDFAEVEKFIDT